MPLVKSKTPEAFRKNVKAEVQAGKPVKQAVAIAYSVKRAAEKKKKSKHSKTASSLSAMLKSIPCLYCPRTHRPKPALPWLLGQNA
jgi:hypothetical protein